ncbi:MAG TPA: hypothetical protein VHE55_04855 [Fimbriimonadaceae bacterium]|nr:hypothetical protein [Fimbriimonadaceae bacterium]
MIWLQGSLSFLVWIGYGVIQNRRSHRIREDVGRMPRAQRGALGAALFVVGAMVLIGGLAIIQQNGGFTDTGMAYWAWAVVSVLGLAFVHAQTMGMAMLVSLVQENVTNLPQSASMNRTTRDRTQP